VISRLPFGRIEVIYNGEVIAERSARDRRTVQVEEEVNVSRGGWIVARVAGGGQTHAGSTVFAHTSPIYVRIPGTPQRRAEDAGSFIDEIEESIQFIRKSYRFAKDADRALALGRFEEGTRAFAKVAVER
jgi:hypothetical protein